FANALLHFRISQTFPLQPELLAHGHNLAAKNRKALVENTARAHAVIKKPGPANRLRNFWDLVKQTRPRRHGIAAIDVAASGLKEMRIGMEGDIRDAVPMLGRVSDQ